MKTTGIVLIVFGGLSTIGGMMAAAAGRNPNLVGLGLIVLGLFLISRASKKKQEKQDKNRWEEGNTDNE